MPWLRVWGISEWARRLRSHRATRSVLSLTILFAIIYVALYLAVGPDLLPGGNAWSTLLIFLAAHVGGALCGMLGLPPLLGMLLAGLLLRNATPSLVAGLPPSWSATFRALALGTIFLRSGLELDLQLFRRVGPAAVRLLLLPGLVEAFTTGGVAIGLMRMPPFWALTMGFILKAVGPAVVIQTMFDLQKRGLGVDKGIPAIVVGAASFDDMVAISGYSLFSSLAMSSIPGAHGGHGGHGGGGHGGGGGVTTSGGLLWALLHGPLDITLGVVAGLVGAALCAATRLWDSPLKRTAVVFAAANALLFALYRFEFRGGGAMAALVLGLAVNVLWERGSLFFWGLGRRSGLTRGPQPRYAAEVEARVGLFWRVVAQPLLFGIIGSLVNLRTVSGSVIPKSLALIAIGMAVRVPTTFLAMSGAGLTTRERIFVAVAWTPKATVQAALGAQPLDMIRTAAGPHSPLMEVGHEILTTSVFAIIVCANVGVSLIHFLAPRWLNRTLPPVRTIATADSPPPPPPADTGCGAVGGSRGLAAGPGGGGGSGGESSSGGEEGRGGGGGRRGRGMRPLRVGPRGYNWAEESYSPTPRSVSLSTADGSAFAAALAASGGRRRSGDLWCRCGADAACKEGGKEGIQYGNGGGTSSSATLTATTPPQGGGRQPLPPSRKGEDRDADALHGPEPYTPSGVFKDGASNGNGGATGTSTPNVTDPADLSSIQDYGKPGCATPSPAWEGLRRCRRCHCLLPATGKGGYDRATPPLPPLPPTAPRPQRPPHHHRPGRHTPRGSLFANEASEVSGGGVSDSGGVGRRNSVGSGAAPALPLAMARSRSAPTGIPPAEELLAGAANGEATAGAAAEGSSGGGGGRRLKLAVLQRQLEDLMAAAADVAGLAAHFVSETPPPPPPSPAPTGSAATTTADATALAERAVALRHAAAAIRLQVAGAVQSRAAGGGGLGWMSGEEADDEEGSDADGGGDADEAPPTETARAFVRHIQAAGVAATGLGGGSSGAAEPGGGAAADSGNVDEETGLGANVAGSVGVAGAARRG